MQRTTEFTYKPNTNVLYIYMPILISQYDSYPFFVENYESTI